MIYGVYSMRDKLFGYGLANCQVNDDVAIRNFSMVVNDPEQTLVSAHYEDYELYKVGEFDSETGVLDPFKVPKLLVKGESIKKKES